MTNLRFILASTLSVVLLSACGGGGSTNINNIIDDVVNPETPNTSSGLKVVLPYGLEKSDGVIALSFGSNIGSFVSATGSHNLLGVPEMIESIMPDELDDPSNPTIVSEYIFRKCQSGSAEYSDNQPAAPVRLLDPRDDLGNSMAHLMANNCKLISDVHFHRPGYVDGSFDGSSTRVPRVVTGSESQTITTILEYNNYAYIGTSEALTLSIQELENKVVTLTGNTSTEQIIHADESQEVTIISPHRVYKTSPGDSFVIDDLFLKHKSLPSGAGGIIEAANFTATWNMGDSGSGSKLIFHEEIAALLGYGAHDAGAFTFPKGDYDLRVTVNSPLSSSSSQFISPTEGSITFDLVSHNIKADIVYHPGFADVTYTRNGATELVQIDTL